MLGSKRALELAELALDLGLDVERLLAPARPPLTDEELVDRYGPHLNRTPAGGWDAGIEAEQPEKPWWQQENPKDKLHELKLEHLESEADDILAKRMVTGFFVAVDRTFRWNDRTWYKTTKGLVTPAERFWQTAGPKLKGVEIPNTGAPTRGTGLLVTSTLLFGGGEGGPAPVLRAWDKKTGAVVAEIQMPGPTTGFPVTYTKAGRQYIAVAVRVADAVEIVALALPAATAPSGRGGR